MENTTNAETGRPVSLRDLDFIKKYSPANKLGYFMSIGDDPEKTKEFMDFILGKVHGGEMAYPEDARFRIEAFATPEGIQPIGATLLAESRQRRQAVAEEIRRGGLRR